MNIEYLPDDILLNEIILSQGKNLSYSDIIHLSKVSTRFRNLLLKEKNREKIEAIYLTSITRITDVESYYEDKLNTIQVEIIFLSELVRIFLDFADWKYVNQRIEHLKYNYSIRIGNIEELYNIIPNNKTTKIYPYLARSTPIKYELTDIGKYINSKSFKDLKEASIANQSLFVYQESDEIREFYTFTNSLMIKAIMRKSDDTVIYEFYDILTNQLNPNFYAQLNIKNNTLQNFTFYKNQKPEFQITFDYSSINKYKFTSKRRPSKKFRHSILELLNYMEKDHRLYKLHFGYTDTETEAEYYADF